MKVLLSVLATACAIEAHASTRSWNFRVLLDGREVGWHSFTRAETQEGARVVSEARFDVRFLFLTAYRYEHRAEERWRGDCLVSIEARTDDNGARKDVNVRPSGCLRSFSYWDPAILRAERLLNAQTGEVVPVTFTRIGDENVLVRGQDTRATRHRLSAPGLSIDLWYAGRDWVALESSVEGGRSLRYELS